MIAGFVRQVFLAVAAGTAAGMFLYNLFAAVVQALADII